MFSWTTPVAEVVLRGRLLYLGLVVLLRVVGQHESGGLTSSVVLDALAYRSPRLARLPKARPRPLIEDGEVNERTLPRELLSRDELGAQLRLHGMRDVAEVERAYREPNGMISVFKGDCRIEEPVDPPPTLG